MFLKTRPPSRVCPAGDSHLMTDPGQRESLRSAKRPFIKSAVKLSGELMFAVCDTCSVVFSLPVSHAHTCTHMHTHTAAAVCPLGTLTPAPIIAPQTSSSRGVDGVLQQTEMLTNLV